jgi:hypothetical protein
MKLPTWVKALFSKVWASLREFLKQVFTQSVEQVLAAIKDIAVQAVSEIENSTTLTDEQKRKAAFDKIKAYAIEKGIGAKDRIINLAIELALTYIKNIK